MAKSDLRAALGSMVEQYGFKTVSRILHEMEAGNSGLSAEDKGETLSRRPRKSSKRTRRRVSAVDYVGAMEVPADRAAAVRHAAEEFERGAFLPTLSDVRGFCDAYGIKEPRSRSRASSIPRIFKFLATMDGLDVERMLDDRMFSGPASLGPIADAIRGRARHYRENGSVGPPVTGRTP